MLQPLSSLVKPGGFKGGTGQNPDEFRELNPSHRGEETRVLGWGRAAVPARGPWLLQLQGPIPLNPETRVRALASGGGEQGWGWEEVGLGITSAARGLRAATPFYCNIGVVNVCYFY